jgi:hypothetical protein
MTDPAGLSDAHQEIADHLAIMVDRVASPRLAFALVASNEAELTHIGIRDPWHVVVARLRKIADELESKHGPSA